VSGSIRSQRPVPTRQCDAAVAPADCAARNNSSLIPSNLPAAAYQKPLRALKHSALKMHVQNASPRMYHKESFMLH
jgi:hypothetical protein